MLRRLASVTKVLSPALVTTTAGEVPEGNKAPASLQRAKLLRTGDTLVKPLAAKRKKRLDLPFHTPEDMLATAMSGRKSFDLHAMAVNGKFLREAAHNTASAKAIKLPDIGANVTAGELVDAFRQIDVSTLLRKGVAPTAVFDFDGTLALGEVFFEFSKLLMQANAFPAVNAARCAKLLEQATEGRVPAASLAHLSTGEVVTTATTMAHHGELSLGAAFYVYICAMTGMRMSTLTAMADRLFTDGGTIPYKNNVFLGAPEIVDTLKAKGVEPHIVTMGLAFIPRAGAKYVGIKAENVHGYELEVIDDVVTGRAIDVKSVGKHRMCDFKLPSVPLFAFGDSYDSDTPLLQRASAAAFVVDPNKAMREYMDAHGSDYKHLTFGGKTVA